LELATLQQQIQAGNWLMLQQLLLSPRGELQPPQRWTEPLASSTGVLWWWCIPTAGNVDIPALHREAEAVVAACCLAPPAPLPSWTVADVPADIIAQIDAQAQGSDLPDGYFSTMDGYIDVDGNRTKNHPEFEARLADYVVQHNAEVQARNAVFAQVAALPVFKA